MNLFAPTSEPIMNEHTDAAWQAVADALGNLGYDLNSHEDTAAWVQQYLFEPQCEQSPEVPEPSTEVRLADLSPTGKDEITCGTCIRAFDYHFGD